MSSPFRHKHRWVETHRFKTSHLSLLLRIIWVDANLCRVLRAKCLRVTLD